MSKNATENTDTTNRDDQTSPHASWIVETDKTIGVRRPDWMTNRDWARLRAESEAHMSTLVEKVTGRCQTRTWCVENAMGEEHDVAHVSRTVELAGSTRESWCRGEAEELHGWSAWMVENRPGGTPRVQFEGVFVSGEIVFDVAAGTALAVLEATATPEARDALVKLLIDTVGHEPAAPVTDR